MKSLVIYDSGFGNTKKIAAAIAGGKLVGLPKGFIVEGKEGSLREGELKRAGGWARKIWEELS